MNTSTPHQIDRSSAFSTTPDIKLAQERWKSDIELAQERWKYEIKLAQERWNSILQYMLVIFLYFV